MIFCPNQELSFYVNEVYTKMNRIYPILEDYDIYLKLNPRLTTTLGHCIAVRNNSIDPLKKRYDIEISEKFFTARKKEAPNEVGGVIAHELCHTLPGCMNHNSTAWKTVANRVTAIGYPISRCYNGEYKTPKNYRYKLVCEACGWNKKYQKQTKIIQVGLVYGTDAINKRWRCPICKKQAFAIEFI